MAKKNIPVWQMLGQPEPPIVRGYWTYGTVFTPGMEPGRREVWRNEIRWALWSYKHWGRKIKKDLKLAFRERLARKGEVSTLD